MLETYMAERPLLLGVRWLRMELSLSAAILQEDEIADTSQM